MYVPVICYRLTSRGNDWCSEKSLLVVQTFKDDVELCVMGRFIRHSPKGD